MYGEIAESQLRAGCAGFRPAGVFVGLVVLETSDVRPTIIGASFKNVDLVVGFRSVFGRIQRAIRSEVDALRVAVAVRKDVTHKTVELRIICRDGTIEIQTKRFPDIGSVVLVIDFFLSGQALGFDGETAITELIVALVPERKIKLLVGAKLEAPGDV